MSIDADMRAGTIDMEEAKRRRSDLERENQLYGAMDGAMKFVKGDAIAGLIITAINIVAGLIIGVTQKGMEVSKALTTYSILTIGDGLVSQIPALLISITAGIIVTKVGAADGSILGRDIGKQVLSQPKALLVGGCMVVCMMLMPGFPKAPFLILASVILTVGYTLNATKNTNTRSMLSSCGSTISTTHLFTPFIPVPLSRPPAAGLRKVLSPVRNLNNFFF